MTVAIATDPIGYSGSRVDEASSVPVTREYVRTGLSGPTFDVPVQKAPPGLPMWKLILLREGYEEQADEARELSELAIPAAIQAMDSPY